MEKNGSRALWLGIAATKSMCTDAITTTKAAAAASTGSSLSSLSSIFSASSPSSSSLSSVFSASSPSSLSSSSSRSLYRRLSVLGADSEGSVTKTLNKWLREGNSVKKQNILGFVKEFRKYKRFNDALELMEWMEKKGTNMSYRDHAVRLDLLSRTKGIEAAEKYFESLSEFAKNYMTYGALMNCYCMERMPEKAITLFQKMRELNSVCTPLPYNNLMTMYMKLDQPEKVPPLFEEMKAANILPDRFAYNVLMNSYASMKDIEMVERILEEINGSTGCDWTVYSNLAAIYVAAGIFDKADLALKECEKMIDARDRMAHHFVISLYAGTHNLAAVKRIWESLKKHFLKTTNLSYLVMLQALSRLDDMDGLKKLYEEWVSSYSFYDMRLTNVLINHYLRRGMIEEAKVLVENARTRGSGPNFKTLESFIDFYLKNNDIEQALESMRIAVAMVKENEWQPNEEKIRAFLKYFEEKQDTEGAEEFCKLLKKVHSIDSDVNRASHATADERR